VRTSLRDSVGLKLTGAVLALVGGIAAAVVAIDLVRGVLS
jgi:hypothetical protein